MKKLTLELILWKDVTGKENAKFSEAGNIYLYQVGFVIEEDKENVIICHCLQVPDEGETIYGTDNNDYVVIPIQNIVDRVVIGKFDQDTLF